jgi:hypothetical protein
VKTIWKFELPKVGENAVDMPANSKLLRAGFQQDLLVLWAEVAPMEPKTVRRIYVAGTGEDFDRDDVMTHVDTAAQDGLYVWHIYDGGESHP